jgi:hypothetical protein
MCNFLSSYGQKGWKLGLGNNLTEYNFLTSKGLPVTFLKQGSGNSIFISSERAFLDTLSFAGQTTKKAIYYQNHSFAAKLFTHLTYDLGITYNQYNAVGDTQMMLFNYQTNYMGIMGGLGPFINLGKGLSVAFKGTASLQKILQGSQQLSNQYIDLKQEVEFNGLKIFTGYSAELIKNMNNGLSLFVQAQRTQTYNKAVAGQENLNFSALNFSFGLKIRN